MTLKRFSARWASQFLALPAAVLLLVTFSLAQPDPDPDPPGEVPPDIEFPECGEGQHLCDEGWQYINDLWYYPSPTCCFLNLDCAISYTTNPDGTVDDIWNTCKSQV